MSQTTLDVDTNSATLGQFLSGMAQLLDEKRMELAELSLAHGESSSTMSHAEAQDKVRAFLCGAISALEHRLVDPALTPKTVKHQS